MREARTAAATAPAITGAVRVGGGQGDGVQFVFVGACISMAQGCSMLLLLKPLQWRLPMDSLHQTLLP
jgi:hypothetical protein